IRYIFLWADRRDDRFPALAADLVARPVDVIIAFGDPAIRAVQRATSTIPIVGLADDMVGSAFAASMARPGGNVTGVSILAGELDAKRLALLHELLPHARRVGVLADPTTVLTFSQVEKAARDLGIEVVTRPAKNREEIGRALDSMIAARVGAVNVLASPVLNLHRGFIIDRLRQARLPAIYHWPEERPGWRARVLWATTCAGLSVDGAIRRQNPERGQARRPACRTAHDVRVSDQPQDRAGSRPDDPAIGAGAGRR